MADRREELRARLEAEAEAVIDELMAWDEETPEPSFDEIEEVVLKYRQRLGQRMASILAEGRAENAPVPGPKCPQCGREMGYKGRKSRQVDSRVGRVPIGRGYYYCRDCRQKIFPPG